MTKKKKRRKTKNKKKDCQGQLKLDWRLGREDKGQRKMVLGVKGRESVRHEFLP